MEKGEILRNTGGRRRASASLRPEGGPEAGAASGAPERIAIFLKKDCNSRPVCV